MLKKIEREDYLLWLKESRPRLIAAIFAILGVIIGLPGIIFWAALVFATSLGYVPASSPMLVLMEILFWAGYGGVSCSCILSSILIVKFERQKGGTCE
ncbi:MAG: hypothetical protein DRJ03_10050 [Chloroflexi bacterium]|nr:MAG: hypothetical protein DRJ03_10050 [Chloroflexota bacterium]